MSPSPTTTHVHRLCIFFEIFNFKYSKSIGSHVRSILFFSSRKIVREPRHIALIIRAFDLLMVRPISFRSFPGDIDKNDSFCAAASRTF